MLDMLETQIFSLILSRFSERIKNRYPDLDFTTSDRAATATKFPTVYVHLMSSPETGSTIDGTEIPAVDATFQIDVIDNQSQSRADEVSYEVLRIMKELRFKVVGMPFHDNTNDTYRTVARYRRLVGDGDLMI